MVAYWSSKLEALFGELKSGTNGLAQKEAEKRLEQFGLNKIERKKRTSPVMIFLSQFKSILIAILIFATILSAYLGNMLDASVILSIIVLNAIIGFFQEYRAEKAIEALEKFAAPKARVLRDGRITEIFAESVVPGDIAILETGDRVPADARLIEAMSLATDESTLTGESTPVEKFVDELEDSTPLAERKNFVFMNSVVIRGKAKCLVVGTGRQTEIGKIAAEIEDIKSEQTPLQKRLNSLSKSLGAVIILIAGLVFTIEYFRGLNIIDMALTSISLAVAVVPEGLPAVITIGLAIGVQRLASAKSIMRKLASAETLGSCSVICSDKTGTLTKNQMTVKEIFASGRYFSVDGQGYMPDGEILFENKEVDTKKEDELAKTLLCGVLCNNASLYRDKTGWQISGDPTEAALLVSARKAGFNEKFLKSEYNQIAELSFDASRKRMGSVFKFRNKTMAFVKGAPESVLSKCKFIMKNGRVKFLTSHDKDEILKANSAMASKALRVLAFAEREMLSTVRNYKIENTESDLVFLGLQGMIDPPRPEAKSAIRACTDAGIKVIMVTGDHALTAKAIAQQLGLRGDVINGTELEKMADKTLAEKITGVSVFARVTPEDKIRIVRALQNKNKVVAMTGDGVNDAPALKKADIGISMGSGTDVAKEASVMILEDDNFATIVKAIEIGRSIYNNIRKFVLYLLSSNVGEAFVILGASLAGLPLPLIAVQILWMNLLTDGLPAISLAFDPAEKEVMKKKPRQPSDPIVNNDMVGTILLVGLVMLFSALGLFKFELLSGASLESARTVAFTTLVIIELFNVFNSRSETESAFRGAFSNNYLILAVASTVMLQLAVVYVPQLQAAFGTTALSLGQWALIASAGFVTVIAVEIKKFLKRQNPTASATF
ncbi:MAG: calcium-translocating P-type ATPase, SERCA-type [DPANN group archaeon]|nr:calcium-translocating P-type ATPase, SERCA-type [DPANN group archaeon]